MLDSQEQEIANGLTQEDGTYSIELTAGDNYKVVIEKDGYLTHTVINIPATYGVRRYVGFAELIAGEVATEDEYIELRDLVQVRRKVRANTAVDSSTEKYDFNEDGIIDSKDLDIVTKNYDKKAKVVEYTKAVNIIGEVLDADSIYVQNATVEMEAIAITNETGEFNLGDIGLGDYTLIVKDSKGNVIGSEEITIAEGTEYTIQNNVITITPNTGIVDITVRVNGTIAIISKRGEESDADIVNPENVTLNAEIVDNGIKLTATAEDSNLSKFTFYSVAEDGTRTEIAAEAITGVTTATVEKVYVKATQFNEIYKFEVDVKDMFGNAATANAQITDNTIKTVDDLVEFSKLVNSSDSTIRNNYEGQTLTLAEDLDLADLGDGKTFNPIGSRGKTFKGTFDGKGHTISNININAKGFTGLFGYTEGAIIKNIGIESGNITSTTGNNVGGIVGFAKGTLIENCYNKANVTAIGSNVGGIVGSAQGTTILTNCYSTGTISGASSIGGIAGTITERETIQNCYSIGTITGTDSVGEIVGTISVDQTIKTEEEYGMFENCYYLVTNTNPGIGETMSEQTYVAEPITDITTLLSELGDAFKADFETPINNGYPILAWEEDPLTLMSLRESEVTLPISGEYTITSEFGTRIDPITGEEGDKHYGMDIASNYQDPILAIANGTVTFAGENGGYGYCVEIEHVINGETVYSFYAHLNRIDVEVGDTVVKGEQIGLEGGRPGDPGAGTSTGVHLHLEIRKISGSYSSAVDPRNYLEF